MKYNLFAIIRHTGVKNFIKKALIYVYRRSGIQAYFTKFYDYETDLQQKFGELQFEWENVPFLRGEHLKRTSRRFQNLPVAVRSKLKDNADELIEGNYTLFSYHKLKLEKLDFNLDPLENIKWPRKPHSSLFFQFDETLGDIKRVWELNRFVFADRLIPAFHLTSDEGLKQEIRSLFLGWLREWMKQNPHKKTVAWSCSQEISIRCINLILLFRHLKCDAESETGKSFKNLLALSARHVYGEIEYAKTQRNNHAITESTFLLLFSRLFPDNKLSPKYKSEGLKTLSFCLDDQFFEDGTYIQNSITYQRFALQSIIIAKNLIANINVKKQIDEILSDSLTFLYNITFGETGDFPNYGNNDGALLYDWNGSGYRDMRPLLNLLSISCNSRPIYKEPALLIDAIILSDGYNPGKVDKTFQPDQKNSFEQGGCYLIKNSKFSAFLSCSSTNGPHPSQSDELHVDLWMEGKPCLSDSGTYEYFGASGRGNFLYHLSTAAHNTIKINNQDQLEKGPRFTWLSSLNSKIISHSRDKIIAETYAYHGRVAGNPTHRRTIEFINRNEVLVKDEVLGIQNTQIEMFWHSDEIEYDRNKENLFYINNKAEIEFKADQPFSINIKKTPRSLYYAAREQTDAFYIYTIGKKDSITINTIIRAI